MTPRNSAKTAKKNSFAPSAYIFAFFAVNTKSSSVKFNPSQIHRSPSLDTFRLLVKQKFKLLFRIYLVINLNIAIKMG